MCAIWCVAPPFPSLVTSPSSGDSVRAGFARGEASGGLKERVALVPVGQGGISKPPQASRFIFLDPGFLVCTYFFDFMLRIQ